MTSPAAGVDAPFWGHPGPVWSVAVTPDGAQIVSGGDDGSVRVWDRASGAVVGAPLTGHTGGVRSVAVTPDGAEIVTVGSDGTIRIWDLANGVQVAGTQWGAGRRSASPLAEVTSDVESAVDLLDITQDVHTISALAAALSTQPPLSVALLGDWGTGKSTFMQQMNDRVERLASMSRNNRQSLFAANVRQVRFNAWHYSDDNVWVGLIEHLFQTLAGTDLSDPREPEEVQRERNRLDAALAEKRARRQRLARAGGNRRSGIPTWWRLPAVACVLGMHAMVDLGRMLRRNAGRVLLTAGGAAALIVVGVLAWRYLGELIGGIIALFTVFAVLAASARPAAKKVREGAEWLRAEVDRRMSTLDDAIRTDEATLQQLDAARRLGDHLRELRSPHRYEQFRGLVGRIHQDFKRLSDDMAAARRQWENGGAVGPPPLQRIVLYVDDLDRCPPDKVVDVLRAVHLLLALPLFVVVVAVDPRWLRRALRHHHAGLFDPGDDNGEWQASPTDYLDKIFQIPFALRPIGEHAQDYLRSLLPEAVVPQVPPPGVDDRATHPTSEPSPAATTTPVQADTSTVPPPDVETVREEPGAGADSAALRSSAVPVRRVDDLRPEGLRLSGAERDFFPRLGPFVPTPRSAKRLVNLYRLLRIGVPEDELPAFVGDADGGSYQAAATLLAIVISRPAQAREIVSALPAADPAQDVVDFLRDGGWPDLASMIETIRKDAPMHGELVDYQRWATTVARFSFETYDLYLAQEQAQ